MNSMTAGKVEEMIPDFANPDTFVADVPHEAFDAIRSRPGLYWQPAPFGTINGGFWVVTRYEDIVAIEKNPALFTSTEGLNFPSSGKRENPDLLNHLMYMDPPEHSRVRRVAAKAFSPRVVANFDPWVREIVVEVLDDCQKQESFDYVDAVARLVPSRVIAKVMGVPFEERGKIVIWADNLFMAAMQEKAGVERDKVYAEVHAYADVLRDRKLRDSADDMVTVLAQCAEAGEITHREYLYFVHLLIVAGYETTHTLIGQSMRMMLEQPQVQATVDDAMAGMGPGPIVDEFLRYVCPVMNMARTATCDVEIFGETIRKGDLMQMMFTAANRDPAVFADPHRFQPGRTGKNSLAFGSGAHRCIGSALAKLEVVILLEEMAKRGMRLRLNGEPRRGWSTWINQLSYLPVTFA